VLRFAAIFFLQKLWLQAFSALSLPPAVGKTLVAAAVINALYHVAEKVKNFQIPQIKFGGYVGTLTFALPIEITAEKW
jgi:hypothetical protein